MRATTPAKKSSRRAIGAAATIQTQETIRIPAVAAGMAEIMIREVMAGDQAVATVAAGILAEPARCYTTAFTWARMKS